MGRGLFAHLDNLTVSALLRSPLHRLLSGGIMLITLTGRRSGHRLTLPVNYLPDGQTLRVISKRDRTWWRNLRGGAPVRLRLAGQEVEGRGQVVEEPEGVAASLTAVLAQAPQYARFLKVRIGADGRTDRGDTLRAARGRVLVQITIG